MDDDIYSQAIIDDPYEGAIVGNIPKTENLIQKAIRNASGFQRGFANVQTLGGINLAESGADFLADKFLGQPPPEVQSGVEAITHPKAPTAEFIGGALPIARGVQQLGKFGINALFGRQMAKGAIPKATGKLSESIQKVIARSKADPQKFGVPKDEVIKVLEDGLAKSKVPHGEQKAFFQRWINTLKSKKYANKSMLDADDISQLETQAGKAAKFGRTANDPTLQQSAKDVNRYASGRMDILAEKTGVPEFISRSTEKSKLLTASKAKPNNLQKLAREVLKYAVQGTIVGGVASKFIPRD